MFTLFDDFELTGNWWLPSDPAKKIGGVLSFKSREEITLDLFHNLPHSETGIFPKIILGTAFDGTECTLLHCYRLGPMIQALPHGTRAIYGASLLFTRRHYQSVEDIHFSSLAVNYSSLEEWTKRKPFREGYVHDKERLDSVELSYQIPDGFDVQVPAINSRISLMQNFTSRSNEYKAAQWKIDLFLRITPEESRPYTWFVNTTSSLRNLLSLLTGHSVYPRSIRDLRGAVSIDTRYFPPSAVEVFFAQPRRRESRDIHPDEMLVTLPLIESTLGNVFESWFKNQARLATVRALFFATIYNSDLYSESTFLFFMQALESYHRGLGDDKYVPGEQYNEYESTLVDALPEKMPASLKDSLRSRLHYGNEYSLRKRMTLIIGRLNETNVSQITDDTKRFIGKVVDTRNYLTHHDEDLREAAASRNELDDLNNKLRALLTAVLLTETGIEESLVTKAIKQVLDPPMFAEAYSNL